MTEDEAVKALLNETRRSPKSLIGSIFTCGCCIDEEYVIEKLEPLLRDAFRAGQVYQESKDSR
jgi:hypothetical protein